MPVECPKCGSDELKPLEVLPDERRRLRCETCGNEWVRGEPKRVYRKVERTITEIRRSFPSSADVSRSTMARATALKRQYLGANPAPPERTTEFRERYRRLFSSEGLVRATPDDLKYFANANVAANPGNMSVFNSEWNKLGDEEAASKVREAIGYLLYGPEGTYIEDRLTNLIRDTRPPAMKGFREALLTKVLCMVEPSRFLPILMYTGFAGKREIADAVYGLELPGPESVSRTIGRLIIWSNDLLLDLAGDGFVDPEHIAGYLWWAKDQTLAG